MILEVTLALALAGPCQVGGELAGRDESDIVRMAREAKAKGSAQKKYSNATLARMQGAKVSFTSQWQPPKEISGPVEIPISPPRHGQVNIPAARKKPKRAVEKLDDDKKLTKRGIRILYLRRPAARSRSGKSKPAEPVLGPGLFRRPQSAPVRP